MARNKAILEQLGTPDICVSFYRNDISWLEEFFPRCIFYDKSWRGVPASNYASQKSPAEPLRSVYPSINVVETNQNGYNIADYLAYIIEFYDVLPPIVYFIKGNAYPRHVSHDYALRFLRSNVVMGLNEGTHSRNTLAPLVSTGTFLEANTSWYTDIGIHQPKFFSSFNQFFEFCFPKEELPTFLSFSPGACFSIDAASIRNYPRAFYTNLLSFTLHSRLPAESLYLERYLECMFAKKPEVSEVMQTNLEEETYTLLQRQ